MNEYITYINRFRLPLSLKALKQLFTIGTIVMFGFAVFKSFDNGEVLWKIARDESGELGWHLLVFIIFSSLLSKLFPKIYAIKQLLPLRKEAGIFVFIIICFHVLFHFLRMDILRDYYGMYLETFGNNWAIISGTISFVIMFPLFITSTNYACKKIGYKSWKLLHKLSHIAFILAAVHVAFIDFPQHREIEAGPLILLIAYSIGYLWLFVKNRNI